MELVDCNVSIEKALETLSTDRFEGRFDVLGRGALNTEVIVAAGEFQYPLQGTQEYRGWYPIDSGPDKGKGRWAPSWSKFNGRNGSHKGADLFGPNKSPLYAITDGNAEYNVVNDPAGWGNHVYVYFKLGTSTYIAVYAHLDSDSAFPGVKKVRKGDQVAILGCSGNAGGGSCDRSHKCLERTTISDHVHLELIDVGDKSRKDPVVFCGWKPSYADDTSQNVCGGSGQLE